LKQKNLGLGINGVCAQCLIGFLQLLSACFYRQSHN